MNRKFLHSGPSPITIQGKQFPLVIAKRKFWCIHCLSELIRRNAGLVCSENNNHYGFILKSESSKFTQEQRFMKIRNMFPSEYIRGLDIHKPMIVTIKSVKSEGARDRETGGAITEYVMRFNEIPKKLRLNITMAKEVAEALNDREMDSDNWIGKQIVIYSCKLKAFGKVHLVPRLRKAKNQPQPAKQSPSPSKVKPPQSQAEILENFFNKVQEQIPYFKGEDSIYEAMSQVTGKDHNEWKLNNEEIQKLKLYVNNKIDALSEPPANLSPVSTPTNPHDLFALVNSLTNDYYKIENHLFNALGGWPDFNDVDAVDMAIARAVGHADEKETEKGRREHRDVYKDEFIKECPCGCGLKDDICETRRAAVKAANDQIPF